MNKKLVSFKFTCLDYPRTIKTSCIHLIWSFLDAVLSLQNIKLHIIPSVVYRRYDSLIYYTPCSLTSFSTVAALLC